MTKDQEILSKDWFSRGVKPADIALYFTIADLTKTPPERVKSTYDAHHKAVKNHVYNLGRSEPRTSPEG